MTPAQANSAYKNLGEALDKLRKYEAPPEVVDAVLWAKNEVARLTYAHRAPGGEQ